MIHRPADAAGDMLPVLSSSDLLRGTEAVAQLVRERLALPAGDWWENPAWGNEALEMLQESRLTAADQQALASYLSSYIRETPGVQEINDMAFSAEGRRFSFRCSVVTENVDAEINYNLSG